MTKDPLAWLEVAVDALVVGSWPRLTAGQARRPRAEQLAELVADTLPTLLRSLATNRPDEYAHLVSPLGLRDEFDWAAAASALMANGDVRERLLAAARGTAADLSARGRGR